MAGNAQGTQLNPTEADEQMKLVEECVELLAKCRKDSDENRQGQTDFLWTADGKSIELAKVLNARYNSSVSWLDELGKKLARAGKDLNSAIDSTTLLDEQAKATYQKRLSDALGIAGLFRPTAI